MLLNRTIFVRNGEATIDEPIIIYKGDKEIKIEFTIYQTLCKYSAVVNDDLIKASGSSFAQLVIKVPKRLPISEEEPLCTKITDVPIFSEIVQINKKGELVLKITKEMIDEFEEIDLYDFQIRLFDKEKISRNTLPIVYRGIEYREPIAIDDIGNFPEGDGK